MKLADAQTDSDRQRLRESNLIDLENAFKEESPLSDSYDESSASCAAAKLKPALAAPDSKAPASIDQVLDKKLPAQNDTVDGSGHETFPGGLTTGSNLPNGNATSVLNPSDTSQKENIPFESMPQRSNQATVDFSSSTKMNGLNTNGNASDTSEPDPFVFSSVPTRNNTSLSDQRLTQPTSGLSSGNNLNLNRRNPLNSGDSESDPFVTSEIPPRRGSQLSSLPGRSVNLNNSTYQGYYDEDPNYWRRTIIAAIIIVLAIIGLAIGLLAPGIRVEKRPNNGVTGPLVPTFSPAPTAYMPPEGTFSDLYTSAADILIRSEVSPPGTLSRQCRHILCDGDGDISRLTVQERALHFLVFQDATYKSWVFQGADNNINTERVVQRYVITLFAFSTGLEKDAEDLWESATWFEYDKWLEGGNECDWFGLTCAPRSAYVSNRDFVDHTVMTNSRLKGDLPGSDVEEMDLVIGISLNKNNLRGQLPQEIFKLRHLERIELWKNQITGKIHGNIRLLTSLQRLWLHETKNLYGKIPSQIGDLTKLESIFLGGNRLSGTIPTVVGKLSKLNTFAAFDNQLEGNIPEELSSCTELQRLFLDQNNLNGTIPQMIGSLRQLEDFRIHDNKLEGTLPPQMTLLNNLKVLYVNNNMLTGSLSDAIVSGLISLGKHTNPSIF